jgi:hypothetical protein
MAHHSTSSRARLRTVFGVAGLAMAMIAWTAPGAVAATPNSAGANTPHLRPERATEAPSTTCADKGTSHSIQVSDNLSDVHATGKWNKKDPTKLVFDLKATPRFGLNLDFSGHVLCDTELTLAEFPIGDTGLILQIGPKLEFSATGEIGADFTWKPSIDVGFTIDKGKFAKGPLAFTNGTGAVFTGSGTLTMHLGLQAKIETVGDVIGVEGNIGPTLTAKVTGTTATDTACWKVSVAAYAHFDTFISTSWFKKKFFSKDWQLGKEKSFGACLAKTVIFDGTPGTGAPPAKLGPYTMTPFAADDTPVGTVESKISGPTGTISVDPGLDHLTVGDGWETWSNGYTGDVYEDTTALPDGNFQITVTLPPDTGAFYAYVEPNLFKDYAINATSNNGVTSGDVTVNGNAGATYFGFYATCGHTIKSITYVDSGGDTAMAIGEFGIAPKC